MIEKNEKLRLMSPKKIAELGPLLSQYLVYQRLSDGAAHTTARALDFHVHRYTDGSGWIYKWGPGSKEENAATLNYACLAAISIGIGVSELLNAISQNATLSTHSERLNKMPPVKII